MAGYADDDTPVDAGAAREDEVRLTLTECARLVNAVSSECGYNMQLAGSGNNRGMSDTDWLGRDLHTDPGSVAAARKAAADVIRSGRQLRMSTLAQRPSSCSAGAAAAGAHQQPTTACAGRTPVSSRHHACIKVKPDWQAKLEPGMDLQRSCNQRLLLPALQQLFGDMVAEEVCMGMLMTQTGHIVVRRTGLSSLVHSPVIGLEHLPLSLLALLRGCYLYASEEQHLGRELVPVTPPAGWNQEGQQWPKAKSKRVASPGAAATPPRGKRIKSAGHQQRGLAGSQQELVSDSGSGLGLNNTARPVLPLFTTRAVDLVHVGFDAVGLTGCVHSKTSRATVAEGLVGGQRAAIKWFPLGSPSAACDIEHELVVYSHLRTHASESSPAPALLAVGRLAHTGAAFLAMADAGVPLTSAQLQDRSEVVAAARALKALHRAGVAHGDIHPGNFLKAEAAIKLVDFTSASVLSNTSDKTAELLKGDVCAFAEMLEEAGATKQVVEAARHVLAASC